VYFVPQVRGVLAVMLVNVFAFAFAPGVVGVHGLPDGDLFAFHGAVACGGDFGEEFGSGVSGGLGAGALAVSADGFPVAFAQVVGVPEAVHAVGFAGFGIALGGQAEEDAFKLCFGVFSAGCVAHGSKVPARCGEGKMLIQNLSKTEISDKKLRDNYAIKFELSREASRMWDGEREQKACQEWPVSAPNFQPILKMDQGHLLFGVTLINNPLPLVWSMPSSIS
jgi:hypothetical protein